MSWNTCTTAQVWLSWFCHKIVMDVHAWQKTWPTVTNMYHHVSVFFCSVVSRKGQRERKGTSRRMASKLLLKWRSPSLDLSLKLSVSTTKEMVTRSRTNPNIWWIRRMAKWTKVYLIYRLLMCTLLVFIVTLGYLILVRLLRLVTQNRSYRINRD